MSQVRLSDEQDRVIVSDQTSSILLQVIDQRPRVVVEQDAVKVVTVGTQGPAGPPVPVPGTAGDVLFSSGAALAADTGEFTYLLAQRSLQVRKITGTVLDGGNF